MGTTMNGAVIVEGLRFPEGPTVGPDGTMLVSDIAAGEILLVGTDGSKEVCARPGGGPNGIVRGPDGCLYVANNGGIGWENGRADPGGQKEHSRIERVDADGSVAELYTHHAGQPLIGASDITVDAAGMLWFTDLGHGEIRDPHGHVYRARSDGSEIVQVADQCRWPNGIAFTRDGTHLLVAETGARAVYSYEVVADGTGLADKQEFAKLPKGYYPDGLCVDVEGNVLVAGTFGGALVVFDGSGELLETIKLDDSLVTNVAFGGADYDELFLTQARGGTVLHMGWTRPGSRLPFDL